MPKGDRIRNYKREKENGQEDLFRGLELVREERTRDVFDILQLAQIFAFCSLPYRPSEERQVSHTARLGDGSKVEVIFTALRPGVPLAYGNDRSLLYWLIDRAIREQSAFIPWEHASEYLKAMKQHESGRNRELLRERFKRISSTGITVVRTSGGEEQLNMPIIRRSSLPPSVAGGERMLALPKTDKVFGVQFDEGFVNDFMSHRIPVLRSLLVATQARPQMQDCMFFLIWRSYSAGQESCITWDALREQFWQADSNESRIRLRFREAIGLLKAAWPELQATATLRGLLIGPPKHGTQFIPQLKAPKHIGARAERAKEAERRALEAKQDAEMKAHREKLIQKLFPDGKNRPAAPNQTSASSVGMTRIGDIHLSRG